MKTLVSLIIISLITLTLYQANVFLKINEIAPTNCEQIKGMQGPEDIIKVDNYIITSGSNLKDNSEKWKQGGLYSYNILTKEVKNLTTTVNIKLNIHGITSRKNTDGSWTIFAINHAPDKDEVLVFKFINNHITLKETITSDIIYQLNDIVLVGDNRFIVTQDHYFKNKYMKLIENFARLGLSKMLYYDGKKFTPLGPGFTFANGITLIAPNKIAVASMLNKSIIVFDVTTTASIKKEYTIDLDFFPDNLSYAKDTNDLIISGHYKILTLKKHSENPHKVVSPSKVISYNLESKNKSTLVSSERPAYSGVSVAIRDKGHLFIGYIYQDYIMDCKL